MTPRGPVLEEIGTHLRAQRWFGARGAHLSRIDVADVISLPWCDTAFGIVLVDCVLDSRTRRYQVPLLLENAAAHGRHSQDAWPPIAQPLVPAETDPRFQRALASAIGSGVEAAGARGSRWRIEPMRAGISIPADAPALVSQSEQSNTSIVFGDAAILKFFRRVEGGEHPEAEISAFLSGEGFPNTPALLATIRLEAPGQEPATAGLVFSYVRDAHDAWSGAIAAARDAILDGSGHTARGAGVPFARESSRLGTVTRDMHRVLASARAPALAPEPASDTEVRRWTDATTHRLADALSLLDRAVAGGALAKDRHAEARALVARREHLAAWIERVARAVGADGGTCIRIHGDYHLGQVLMTPDGSFAVIDFEGEPTRSLAERRQKTSALRDVAGMLRSFGYVAAMARQDADRSDRPVRGPTHELAASRWERAMREAFTSSYRSGETPFLPRDAAAGRALLSLFEAEKALYELQYELHSRPDWAWIPMRAISNLLTSER